MNRKSRNQSASVLVTGSTGFLGSRIIETLKGEGFKIRAFARNASRVDQLRHLGVDVYIGDIADLASLRSAFEGTDYVVHAAADTVGSIEGGRLSTIRGTKNILRFCGEYQVKKLIYISSCSVYGVADFKKDEVVTEESSLERKPEARGAYSWAKFQAEKAVLHAMSKNVFPIVCLRPGTIYGPGGNLYTPVMGFSFAKKLFITIDNGKFILPLVYIDNVADAVRLTLETEQGNGKIYNLIDPYQLTKKQYVEELIKKIYPRAKFFYFPYSFLYLIVYLQELLSKTIGREPFLTRYRLESSQKNVRYSGNKIRKELNWMPPVSVDNAIKNLIEYEIQKNS